MAHPNKHEFAGDVTQAERAIVLAAFRKAVGNVLTFPAPSYKQLPKVAKKDMLLKRIIICAQCSNKCAAAAYFKQ